MKKIHASSLSTVALLVQAASWRDVWTTWANLGVLSARMIVKNCLEHRSEHLDHCFPSISSALEGNISKKLYFASCSRSRGDEVRLISLIFFFFTSLVMHPVAPKPNLTSTSSLLSSSITPTQPWIFFNFAKSLSLTSPILGKIPASYSL